MANTWDKKLIIRNESYLEKDGDNGTEKRLSEKEFLEEYKENARENCVVKRKWIKTKRVGKRHYPIETEIMWTEKKLRELLKEKLIGNGKEVRMYNDGMKRNIIVLDENGKFVNMKQLWYGSNKGKRKVNTLMRMSEEGIVNLKVYTRKEFWFEL
jgi:hypothetical protein